jgi:hypothetical protein
MVSDVRVIVGEGVLGVDSEGGAISGDGIAEVLSTIPG